MFWANCSRRVVGKQETSFEEIRVRSAFSSSTLPRTRLQANLRKVRLADRLLLRITCEMAISLQRLCRRLLLEG